MYSERRRQLLKTGLGFVSGTLAAGCGIQQDARLSRPLPQECEQLFNRLTSQPLAEVGNFELQKALTRTRDAIGQHIQLPDTLHFNRNGNYRIYYPFTVNSFLIDRRLRLVAGYETGANGYNVLRAIVMDPIKDGSIFNGVAFYQSEFQGQVQVSTKRQSVYHEAARRFRPYVERGSEVDPVMMLLMGQSFSCDPIFDPEMAEWIRTYYKTDPNRFTELPYIV